MADEYLDQWKENNPEGYQRALGDATEAFKGVADFKADWSPAERDAAVAALPDNPDAIHQAKFDVLQTLTDEELAVRDAVMTVRDNLQLAAELQNMGDDVQYDEVGFEDYVSGLTSASQQELDGLKERTGIDLTINDVAQKYNMTANPLIPDQAAAGSEPVNKTEISPSTPSISFAP